MGLHDFAELSNEQLATIDALSDAFERALHVGEQVTIDGCLEDVAPELRRPLFRELLQAELDYLSENNTPFTVMQYVSRFPDYAQIVEQLAGELNQPVDQGQTIRSGRLDTDSLTSEPNGPDAAIPIAKGYDLWLPKEFGRYRLLLQLGRGGMGEVYLAYDTHLDRQVALKTPVFTGNAAVAGAMIHRFYREARVMAAVSHPNLCPIYDVDEHDGVHYLTMQYIEGGALLELIEDGRALRAEEAVRIVRTLATTIQVVHDRGMVHRDLKPSNVMIDGRQHLYITDFGLATRDDLWETAPTTNNTLIGSPAYMAPEQVRAQHERVGPTTDVYALGVMLYELVCGRRPFLGTGLSVLAEIISGNPPPRPSELADVSVELEAVCLKAMAQDPDDRFQTAAELAAALGGINKCGTPLSGSMATPSPRIRGIVLVLCAVACLMVAVPAAIHYGTKHKSGEVVVDKSVPVETTVISDEVSDKPGTFPQQSPVAEQHTAASTSVDFTKHLPPIPVPSKRSSGQFRPFGNKRGASPSTAVKLADFDGDGDLDAFVINDQLRDGKDEFGNDKFIWFASRVWLNDGLGNFREPDVPVLLHDAHSLELGDLDNDGDLDAFVMSQWDKSNRTALRIWENDGHARFITSQRWGPVTGYTDTALGDVDGDGDLDALVGQAITRGGRDAHLFTNYGGGSGFREEAHVVLRINTLNVELVDLDGDGDLDAFVARNHEERSNIVLENID